MSKNANLNSKEDENSKVCVSCYNPDLERGAKLLKERSAKDVLAIGGGIIPPEDIPVLKNQGISEVFGPGTSIKEIAEYIRRNVKPR